MKLHILSDLHLSVQGMAHPQTDADVVVLAGDISRAERAAPWALEFDRPVLYVLGNHEFYGSSLPEVKADFAARFAGSHVRLLDNDVLEMDGVRFLASTLWTDFRSAGEGAAQQHAMEQASQFMYDFKRVRTAPGDDAPLLTPADTVALFERNRQWLDEQLSQSFDGPTVVITHHAPALPSIHPRFAGSPFNAAFVSDLSDLMDGERVVLWIHGHTHDSFDYTINGTRVLCNPRGYVKEGRSENPAFVPDLVVEVG